jgi:protein tyrosine phosphatase (PTP) superfamily phosphohydrolase (DUF442 family)
VDELLNFHRVSDLILTAGQPTPSQLAGLGRNGVDAVINLAMHDSPNAVPEEGHVIASQGLAYAHIPVPFDQPAPRHVRQFFQLMGAFECQTLLVHCALNLRVAVFMHRYLHLVKGVDEAAACSPLLQQWLPSMEPCWRAIMALQLREIH